MRCAAILVCCKQATENRLLLCQCQGSPTPHDCREQHQLHQLVPPAVPITPAYHAFGGVLLHVPSGILKLLNVNTVNEHACNKNFEERATHLSFIHSIAHRTVPQSLIDPSSVRLCMHSIIHLCLCSLAIESVTACLLWAQITFCCVMQPMTQWGSLPLHDVLPYKLYTHSKRCCKHHSLGWAVCVQAECEFVAEGISKVHVQKADKEEDCWRYMLRWRRLPHVNTQVTAVLNSLHC